jgi:hypothetical protein
MFRVLSIVGLQLACLVSLAEAGDFDSHLDSEVLPASIAAWATTVESYLPTSEVVHLDTYGFGPHDDPNQGLGPADGTTVSLGDLTSPASSTPGSIVVGFQATIVDGPGADFAVFENAGAYFNAHSVDFIFAELAFVEVSSDGTNFARFPSISLNIEPDPNNPDPDKDLFLPDYGDGPLRDFVGINTTNVNNLAGVNVTMTGTPFDLSELAADSLVLDGTVNLNNIHFVRLVDIPGEGTFTDSLGNPILDAWHTVESGGFDLDAVGAINAVPEPTSAVLLAGLLLGGAVLRRRKF